jgi:N-acetylmuramoyl-L-alanine amidase CwlA
MSKPLARVASTHYCVDDSGVYETLNPDLIAWHVVPSAIYGDEAYVQTIRDRFGVLNNTNTLSVDMCCSKGLLVSEKTRSTTAQLIASLVDIYATGKNPIIIARHYDIVGKPCPRDMSPGDPAWYDLCVKFKDRVYSESKTGHCVFAF